MKVCKNCSNIVEDEQNFCANCGSSEFIDKPADQSIDAKQPEKKKKVLSKIGKIFISVVVSLLAIIGLFFTVILLIPDSDSTDWIKSENALFESTDNYYYVYDINHVDFMRRLNENIKTVFDIEDTYYKYDGNGQASALGSQYYQYSYSDDVYYLIDTVGSGIFQTRCRVNYSNLYDEGYSTEDIYNTLSEMTTLALTAYEVIDTEDYFDVYNNLREYLQGNYRNFYINGIYINYSTHNEEGYVMCYIYKIDDDKYNEYINLVTIIDL